MTSQAKRTRERAQREARLLEEIDRLDAEAGGVLRSTSASGVAEGRLVDFRTALDALVDELVGALAPGDRDSIATAIDTGATLRLACDVAPRFTAVLYLGIGQGEHRRFVTIARHGTVAPPADEASHPDAIRPPVN